MDGIPIPRRKRRRPALACTACRRRKIKCDRNTPCRHCASSKNAVCTYISEPPPVAKRQPQVDFTDSSTTISALSHGSPSLFIDLSPFRPSDAVANHVPDTRNSPSTVIPEAWHEPQPSADVENCSSLSTVQAASERQQMLEQKKLSSKNQSAEPPTVSPESNSWRSHWDYSCPNMRGLVMKTRFFGQSHWLNSIEPVGPRFHN